jgi:hypothetical protein
MKRADGKRAIVLLVGLGLMGGTNLRAADPGESKLRKLGLTRAGSLYVLEDESQAEQKRAEAQALIDAYKTAYVQTLDIKFAAARAKEMDDFNIELDHDIEELNVELRYRPARPNNVQRDYYDGLTLRRDDLVLKRFEARTEARRLRSVPIGERALQEAVAEFERRRQVCRPVLEELRSLMETVDAKYADLAKDSVVADALNESRRTTKSKLKLGPSPRYKNIMGELKKMQRYVDSPGSMIQASGKRTSRRKNQRKESE